MCVCVGGGGRGVQMNFNFRLKLKGVKGGGVKPLKLHVTCYEH